MIFSQTDTVGSIVVRFPKGADILQNHNIDYCCGGDKILQDVCQKQNIDIHLVIKELSEYFLSLQTNEIDWTQAPLDKLVHHILQEHHAYLYEALPTLSNLTSKILRVHGEHHPELKDVFTTFHSLKTELDMHLIKEETIQYPSIEQYLKTELEVDLQKAINVITELQDEHELAGNALKSLRKITNHYAIPEDICETFVKTYALLEALEQNTFTHIHLENNILFPRLIQKGLLK